MMSSYPDLADKVVVITGGANGIGRAMVRRFAEQQTRVHFCDLDVAGGKALAAEIGTASFRKVDLTKETQIRTWIDRIGRDQATDRRFDQQRSARSQDNRWTS